MQEKNFILSCYMLTLILIDISYLHDVFTSSSVQSYLFYYNHTYRDQKRKNRNKTREYTDVCLRANQPLS